jgi:hypothetical protein
VRLLAKIETRAAGEALEGCRRSPHLAVRIEALAARGGASGDGLKNELRRLLEDATPQARITTLRTIADAELRAAAPFIALRIRSNEFDALVHEERRSLFNALVVLAPARAEAVALELLEKKVALLGGAAQDESRILAVDALGRAGTSDEALSLLAEIASGRRGSAELGAAASDALERRRKLRRRPGPSAPPGGKA